jgi:ABC-type multidrug transport system fused ATPase/permease subunit
MILAMEHQGHLRKLLLRLWCHIGQRRRMQFLMVLALTVLASFAEVLTIGAVLPFLMVLTAPQSVFSHPFAQPVIHFFGVEQDRQLLLLTTCAFAGASLAAGLLRVALLWANAHLSCQTGADLSISIYRRTLYQPYTVHVSRNTADVISGVAVKTSGVVSNVFGPALTLISAAIMLLSILGMLLFIDYAIALSALAGFSLVYGSIIKLTRKRLAVNSERTTRELNRAVKALQEGLGGIRDVLVDGSQKVYCEIYRDADLRMRRAQAGTLFISQYPRYMIEALGTVLIAVIAYVLASRSGGIGDALPLLGALALGAQRMLPVIQQAYSSWVSINGSSGYLRDTVELLDQALPYYADQPPPAPLPFEREIRLCALEFRYAPDTPLILKKLDLCITKGVRVGFIGATGSGKSTLLDVIMGLLSPTDGSLEVDGVQITNANKRSWQALVAHVPQTIFLTDSSVAENIAFGVPREQIDMDRVRRAAQQAQISELIESWPAKYDMAVGERGIRLSGGQRQRIGIARALYKRAKVIIFDEATSALDSQTEEAVMRAIGGLGSDLTLLIIAHRLTTLSMCDEIIELGNQAVLRKGSYAEIVKQ